MLEVDWSKIEVDTPIYVRDHGFTNWYAQYFAKYEDGVVHTWNFGKTSRSSDETIRWDYARLAECEEK